MSDVYPTFKELLFHEQEGRDFRINFRPKCHPVLIIAPHGGKIEPYTSQIARWLADDDFGWYSFEGINDGDNRRLHITSHNFDEPTLLQALGKAHTVLTVHGLKDSSNEFLMIGGLDTVLSNALRIALEHYGFIVRESEKPYRGVRPTNICNRGRTGKGVQLEISFALRKRINEDLECRDRFVDTIRFQIKNLEKYRNNF